LTPEPLLPKVAAREPSAPRACIERYGPIIWALSLRWCGSHAEAEDAAQEIFIDLWKSAARFDPQAGSEATFVAVVARRRLIDRRRKAARRIDRGEVPEVVIDPIATGSAELSVEAARAAEAILEMRPDHQQVLRMATYEGMSHSEIAEALSMPLGTVKATIRRGLAAIRKRIGGEETSDDKQ
jgi:RNA polymerase sigma-70 factor (ECF subfamily)